VEISEELARERNITSGRWVRIVSRQGAVKVTVLVTSRVFGKQIFLPLTSQDGPVNVLTGSHTDSATNTPAYKETPARLEVLPDQAENPLRILNFRFAGQSP
jgi:formate dehydrogenase major subunit